MSLALKKMCIEYTNTIIRLSMLHNQYDYKYWLGVNDRLVNDKVYIRCQELSLKIKETSILGGNVHLFNTHNVDINTNMIDNKHKRREELIEINLNYFLLFLVSGYEIKPDDALS